MDKKTLLNVFAKALYFEGYAAGWINAPSKLDNCNRHHSKNIIYKRLNYTDDQGFTMCRIHILDNKTLNPTVLSSKFIAKDSWRIEGKIEKFDPYLNPRLKT